MSTPVISCQNIQFTWPNREHPVLDIKELTIDSGKHLFIQGASGSGKTTLLNLLTGINQPNKGSLKILNQDLCAMSHRQRDRFRADHLGVIFQQFNLLPYLSILENVLLPCQFSKHRKSKVDNLESSATNVLDSLKISREMLAKEVMDLSVGQQQRVAVARALMGNPEIIIADEPTSALDTNNRDSFIELLFNQASEHNSTLIFVSHDQQLASHFNNSINLSDINSAYVEDKK